jgi:hypothetical protein
MSKDPLDFLKKQFPFFFQKSNGAEVVIILGTRLGKNPFGKA